MALAVVRFEQQRLTEAAQLFREEIAALTEQSPGGHWMIADARSRLGACLASMGEFDEAESLLLQSHIELRDTFGATHPTTIDARDRIVAMYNSWGRKDLAEQFAS